MKRSTAFSTRSLLSSLAGLAVLLTSVALGPTAAQAAELAPGGTFRDEDGNTHEGYVEALAAEGITTGCNPPGNYRYCPTDAVTRAQMASFIARAFELAPASRDHFPDDDGSTHEENINRLAEAGITLGLSDGTFRPAREVTREQMASFLARAMDLEPANGHRFDDVSGSHEANINAIAAAGVTQGCDAEGLVFCPHDVVRRDQMASFVGRATGLTPLQPPPPVLASVTSITDGDTLRVRLGSADEPVRLIGIDTPEVGAPCFDEASDALASLVQGGTVRLDRDTSERDRYDRLLRYLFVGGTMINEQMVSAGWAEANEYPPDTAFAAVFDAAEDDAKQAGRGIWGQGCADSEPPPAASDCDPAYSGVCIPSPPPDLDCDDISGRNFTVVPPDPHGFDGDGDGVGCET